MSEKIMFEKYKNHKKSAKHRKIPFRLSYDEWLSIWNASGHIKEYGKFVMCRVADKGGYESGNVFIGTREENSRYPTYDAPACWKKQETKKAICMFKNGKSFEEISKEIGRTEGAVKTKIYRNVDLSLWQKVTGA